MLAAAGAEIGPVASSSPKIYVLADSGLFMGSRDSDKLREALRVCLSDKSIYFCVLPQSLDELLAFEDQKERINQIRQMLSLGDRLIFLRDTTFFSGLPF
jgi:hypothetical protein